MKKHLPPQIDIRSGIVPITQAAAKLAEFVKKAKESRQPLLITQNGYPAVVIIDVDSYADLRDLAERALQQAAQQLEGDPFEEAKTYSSARPDTPDQNPSPGMS